MLISVLRTYGATFEDIRGYILDGWQAMDNKKSELEMCNGLDEMNITLEDCFEKEQNESNVHIVVDFDNEAALLNAITRFEKVAQGRIIKLSQSDAPNDNIQFNLVNSENLGLKGDDKINKYIVNCVRYLQCKLECVSEKIVCVQGLSQ